MIAYNPDFLNNTDVLTPAEISVLTDFLQFDLDYFLNNKSLVDKFGLDFIHTSALIEGNTYTKSETLSLLVDGYTADKKYTDAKMILNLQQAYQAVIAADLSITAKMIKDLHFIIADELLPDFERGTPRNGEILIANSDYVPLVNQQKLEDELNYLVSQYHTIKNPFNQALYLHNNLCYLQYFRDCNKRAARIMLNVSLKSNGLMFYIPDETQIRTYRDTITHYYETGEHQQFNHYFIDNYKKVMDSIALLKQNKTTEATMQARKPAAETKEI